MVNQQSCTPGGNELVTVHPEVFPLIPPATGLAEQPGLAGPVSGSQGNFVLVAGGANFENGMPWRGGTKVYHDEVYLMGKSPLGSYAWQQLREKLPFAMAYPGCVSLPEGVLSIGGETQDGPVNNVFLYKVGEGSLKVESLAPLPQPITSAGAASIGQKVYVVGGLTQAGATSAFYMIDMKNAASGWKTLPALPVALSHAVVASQNDGDEVCVYVIGGRNRTGEVSTFYSTVWKYKPSVQKWISERDIQSEGKALGLSAGTGIAVGSEHILLFGGDPGIYFNRTERLNNAIEKASGEEEKQKLRKEKDEMLNNHPGFSRDILAFNTWTKEWKKLGEVAEASPVTTSAFLWNGTVVIPSGEVRPGVRTPNVPGVDIQIEK